MFRKKFQEIAKLVNLKTEKRVFLTMKKKLFKKWQNLISKINFTLTDIWRPPSLSKLTLYEISLGLPQLGSVASI